MSVYPSLDQFEVAAKKYDYVPVSQSFLCDGLTPIQTFHNIDDGQTACLFESVVGGDNVGRYSFLASNPFSEFHATRNNVVVENESGKSEYNVENPVEKLREIIAEYSVAHFDELPPFAGGAIGYASYDVIR